MIIAVHEPGDPGGDAIVVYRGVSAPMSGGAYLVTLSRWPDQPIGYVEHRGPKSWAAWLAMPPGEEDVLVGMGIERKREAVYAVLEAYHFRFGKRKFYTSPSRPPVISRWDLIPRGIPWHGRNETMGQLHRFLGVNRRLFDKPTEIRPYTGEPYAADDIEQHV